MADSGGLFGGGTTTGTTAGSSSPWGPQAAQLQNVFGQAEGIYNQRSAAGPYSGNLYTGLNTNQVNGVNYASGYARDTGTNLAYQQAGAANALTQGAGAYSNNASQMAQNGTQGPNANLSGVLMNYGQGGEMAGVPTVNQGLTGALNSAATSGANAIGGYNAGLTNVMNTAMGDRTGQILGDAQQYMNGAPTQQALNSVNNQIGQTLNEQTLPGLNRQAAMGGGLNSSRAGMAQAQAQEGAGIAMGSADSSILNNAYNQGLGTASQQSLGGLNAGLAAANSGLNSNASLAEGNAGFQLQQQLGLTNSRLGATEAGLSSNLGYEGLNAQTQLAANAQLGQGVNTGLYAGAAANQTASNNAALLNQAGAIQNQSDNAQNGANYQQWLLRNGYQQNLLNNYQQNVSGNYGTTQTGTTAQTAPSSTAGGIIGTGLAAAGLFAPGPGGTASTAANIGSGLSSAYNAISGLF